MKKILLPLISCLFLTGCIVGSSNPFYTPNLVVKVPELNGTWYFDESISSKDESPLIIADEKMTIFDNKGAPSDIKIIFFKVDDVLFLDVFPDQGEIKENLVGLNPPIHLINQVKIKDGKVSFNPLDYEWLAKEVDSTRIWLPHRRADKDADILFTASPDEWVAFLRKYKNDPKAFPPEREAWLVKRAPKENAAK